MDWHFQSAHRMSDAVMRGQHRSWYVDELVSPILSCLPVQFLTSLQDWIKSREIDPDQPAGENGNASGLAVADQKPEAIYLPVPTDPHLANVPCPICQEQFLKQYLNEEFVWMDAIEVGGKIYHATCYEEVYGAKAQAERKRSTPEPGVLGKRKAEASNL